MTTSCHGRRPALRETRQRCPTRTTRRRRRSSVRRAATAAGRPVRRLNGRPVPRRQPSSGSSRTTRSTRRSAPRPPGSPRTRPSGGCSSTGTTCCPRRSAARSSSASSTSSRRSSRSCSRWRRVLVFVAAMLSTGSSRQDNINVTIAIIGVVLLNGVIGFFQEYRAEKATEALQKLVPANAKVVRDGEVTVVAAADLVPGDLHRPRGGRQHQRRRPRRAPVRAVDQQHRPHRRVGRGAQDGRPHPRGGAGRHQHAEPRLHGHERGLGHRPRRGLQHGPRRPSSDASSRSPPASPTRSRRCSGRSTAWRGRCPSSPCSAACCCSSWRCSSSSFGAVPALLFALGVMVALVPEGLPATLSVALSIGVQRMAKAQALIKKLAGVETLGLHQRHLHRQDRHAHQGRDDGEGAVRRRAATSRSPAPATSPWAGSSSTAPSSTATEAKRRLEPHDARHDVLQRRQGAAAVGRPGLARDRRPHRGLPAGRRPEGGLRPADGAHRTAQDLRAAVRVGAQAHVRRARRGRRPEGLRQGRAVRDPLALHAHAPGRRRRADDRRAARAHRGAERRDVAAGAARARGVRARPAERAHRLHAGHGRDRPHLPRSRRHDRPAASRGQRGRRARPRPPASASSW